MPDSPLELRISEALEKRKNENALRSLLPPDPSFTDFCSNDYLGIARSPAFSAAVEAEWHKLKATKVPQLLGSGGSRLLAGDSEYAHRLEKKLADFYRAEDALLFNSGYAANLGLFSALPQRGDTILYDERIHASVRDGIRLSAAKSWSFRHNDTEHLEALLKKAEGNIFVASESVFSMDGDECPLEEIAALCEKYNAAFILDEAHSNGIYGEHGAGLAVEKKAENKIFAQLLTFGKAAGCHGAVVTGSAALKKYLVNFSRSFIYTTALPVHDLAVISCAVDFFSAHDELRKKLQENISYFSAAASRFPQLQQLPSSSAIRGIVFPGNDNARAVAEKCFSHKLDVRAILSPTVSAGSERLRIILHAFNTFAETDKLLEIAVEALKS